MSIDFTCPRCGLHKTIGNEYAGQTGPCAGCGEQVTIPGQAKSQPAARGLPEMKPGQPKAASSSSSTAWVVATVAVLCVLVCCAGGAALMVVPAFFLPQRGLSRGMMCSNNMRQVALAMHNHHDTHGNLPPSSTTFKDGAPMKSWRVEILPFIERSDLYNVYDQEAPWDSADNQFLGETTIQTFQCPDEEHLQFGGLNYLVAVGKPTPFPAPDEQTGFRDITDGTSNTLLNEETLGANFSWIEPLDFDFVAMPRQVNAAADGSAIASNHVGGANVSLCDGSVRFLSDTIDPKVLDLLLMRNDGQPIPAY